MQAELERVAEETGFSGVAVIDHGSDRLANVVKGLAHRGYERPIEVGTRFGLASVTKGFTALTVASLIEAGKVELTTTLTEIVGPALTIDPGVTIEHLLGHTSGVGDYADEETLNHVDDHVLSGFSAHRFERPHHYLPLLNQYPHLTPPGTRFVYNNSGYVMLALAAERVGGKTFPQLVNERVFNPAAMTGAGFPRSDDLGPEAAIGYLENGRSNVFHLPVIGSGDGGAYATADDLTSFWQAVSDGRIISSDMVETLTAVRQILSVEQRQYGLGFWLAADGHIVMLEGMDAGVSCQTALDRRTGLICSILSNTSDGAWPLFARMHQFMEELTQR